MARSVPPEPWMLGLDLPSWRPHQKKTIEKIVNSKERVVILEAPTGYGKSATAAAASKLWDGRTIIAVQSKHLMLQYVRDFPWMDTFIGKENYSCILPGHEKLTVSEAPCATGWACSKRRECPYFVQRRQALGSRTVVLPYAKIFSDHIGNFKNLICDEGHALDDILRAQYTTDLEYDVFDQANIFIPPFGSAQEASEWATGKLTPLEDELKNLTDTLKHLTQGRRWKQGAYLGAIRMRERRDLLRKLINPLRLLSHLDPAALWSVEPYRNRMYIRPVLPTQHARKFFARFDKLLIQSATLHPKRLSDSLGFKRYDHIQIPSLFRTDRRPIFFWPVAKIGMNASEDDLDLLIDAIDKLLDKYTKRRGLIHSVNWHLTEQIGKKSRHRSRLIIQSRGHKRSESIDHYLARPYSVLVSPSVMTGLDGRFEKCRFQIIAKLPFENQGHPAVAERMDADKDWYAYQCAFHLQQAAGRVMRDRMDYGETWLLDSHFEWFFKQHGKLFSPWFKEALSNRTEP